jgi:GNAT superfamily N-acetyltransferase
MITVAAQLVTTYLEMTHPDQLNGSSVPRSDARVERMTTPDVGFYRYLYKAVGEKYRWRDRLSMSNKALYNTLNSPQTHVHVLYVDGAPAGYIELQEQGTAIEIAYFGLREAYHGRGLGKYLLSYGVQKAWQLGARRVWLHTCNLDGEYALANYQKRGFRVYQREIEPMPEIYQ